MKQPTLKTTTVDIRNVTGRDILDVPGFKAQGVYCGLKRKRRDIALIVSDRPTSAAAVFTKNAFAAAPLLVSKQHLQHGDVRAVVINSGNANACTGPEGLRNAREMAARAAQRLGLVAEQVLVSSTGIIGRRMDMQKVRAGIDACAAVLDEAVGGEATEAIMTTDTRAKVVQLEIDTGERVYHLAGIAKGSGMIHPNMATMLGFIVTDAPIAQEHLQGILSAATEATFNQITVDGDSSTNDMVVVLANGAAGGDTLEPGTQAYQGFETALHSAARTLAKAIAADGEGASKLVEVAVVGADTVPAARQAARAVVSSSLVKSAIHGADPNWGRIVSAIGQTGVAVDTQNITVRYETTKGKVTVLDKGEPGDDAALDAAAMLLAGSEIRIVVDLAVGDASGEAWGCDLSEEYVTFNSAYST